MDTNMKSEQEGQIKSSTPCKQCAFCQYEKDIQVGCSIGRLEQFQELEEILETKETDGKTYHVIGRLCNYFRSPDWAEANEGKNLIDLAVQESKPTVAVVVDCQEHTSEKIEKTVNSIKAIDYDHSKVAIVLHVDDSENIWHLVHQVNELKKEFARVKLVVNKQDIRQIKDFDIFSKCSDKAFFTTMKIGAEFCPELFNIVDFIINEELAKIVFIETKETQTVLSSLVKDKYLDYLDYDLMLKDIRQISQDSNMYAYYEEK